MKIKIVLYILILIYSVLTAQNDVRNYIYVAVTSDNKLRISQLDVITGKLSLVENMSLTGGPGPLAVGPLQKYMYVVQGGDKAVSSYSINSGTGKLTYMNTISVPGTATYIATDKTGKYLLAAYYSGNNLAIYEIDVDGKLITGALQTLDTPSKPHSVMTDLTNKFVFVPTLGADEIQQYKIDASNGNITPNSPPAVSTAVGAGPRHFTFHRGKDIVYVVNELNATVSGYNLNPATGTLTQFQAVSTLPASYTGENTCADIHITPDNKYLYASNRGHNSIVGYTVDNLSGQLTLIDYFLIPQWPREFEIDPTGKYLISAGQRADSIAIYKINSETGRLEKLETVSVGSSPSWVLGLTLGGNSNSIYSASMLDLNKGKSYHMQVNSLFLTQTQFQYKVEKPGIIHIEITNTAGKYTGTLINSYQDKGIHFLEWNFRDNNEFYLNPGVFFLKINGNGAFIK